jgi:GAF domain-containing protein
VTDTPCALIRADRAPVALDDTSRNGRSYADNREHGMRSLCGVPLFAEGGAAYGALCHFDGDPRPAMPQAIELLERVARMFRFLSPKSAPQRRSHA